MNAVTKELLDWGCDVQSALERTLNDETFYRDCLKALSTDTNFEELAEALEHQDTKKAFEHAHALKGVLSNLGLTPMLNKVNEILEPLRSGHSESLQQKMRDLQNMKKFLKDILANM